MIKSEYLNLGRDAKKRWLDGIHKNHSYPHDFTDGVGTVRPTAERCGSDTF